MGGTNEIWRDADLEEKKEKEISDTILELYEKCVYKAIEFQKEENGNSPTIFVCSIPPFADVNTLPKNGHKALLFINERIRIWVEKQSNEQIKFCDIHKAMQNEKLYMRDGLAIADGVHFTKKGNKACGEAIARCILKNLQN